jgi:hypothetical protein
MGSEENQFTPPRAGVKKLIFERYGKSYIQLKTGIFYKTENGFYFKKKNTYQHALSGADNAGLCFI